MDSNKILYKVKVLEKLIIKDFITNSSSDKSLVKRPTPTQMQIIEYILKHDGGDVYQRDLEKVLNLKRATVSGVLQTMEKNGLIKREIASDDTRVKKVILNNKTKMIFDKNKRRFYEIESIIVKDIAKDDLEIFSKVIDNMIENMKKKLDGREGESYD